jgi:hypothetical protein
MDPITVEDIYKKKLAFQLYRNNLSPQTTDRVAAMIFDAKYTEVLIDLGFRTLSGEIKTKRALSGYYQKSQQRRYFFYERRLL